MLSYGSAIPLVYRPRLLLCGVEGTGLDHLGPAILHEMEKFPVHSLGLPSLLSDPGAKTPEEALVHIFTEARRTTPSILYLPHFNLWWENAQDQLRAVLLTLLEELPSDLPILLFGTCPVPLEELDDDPFRVFPAHNVFTLSTPSIEDRSIFFERLIEAALSIQSESVTKESVGSKSLPDLPKAPKVATGPKISELKAKAEAQGHALRRLRMCLRDICNRILYDKRFSAFHFPVSDEDAPNYRSIIQNPMDIATLLQHVDSGKYITCKVFLEDFDLIMSNAKKYNGDDYTGARIVSRAYELRDAVHGMLAQMDPTLVAFCEKISAEGGPVVVPDELGSSMLPQTPVLQMTTGTRASARLRSVHPEIIVDRSLESIKRPKKHIDNTHAVEPQDVLPPSSSQQPEPNDVDQPMQENSHVDDAEQCESLQAPGNTAIPEDVTMSDTEMAVEVESIKKQLMEHTSDYGIPHLERLYTRIMKGIFETKNKVKDEDLKPSILSFLLQFSKDKSNF